MSKYQFLDKIGLTVLVERIEQWVVNQGYTKNTGTITGVTTASPLSGGGTEGSVELIHKDSGVTADNYGDSEAQAPAFGETFQVNYEMVNSTGHITSMSSHDVTIPDSVVTNSENGLMSSEDKNILDDVVTQGLTSAWLTDDEGNVILTDDESGVMMDDVYVAVTIDLVKELIAEAISELSA